MSPAIARHVVRHFQPAPTVAEVLSARELQNAATSSDMQVLKALTTAATETFEPTKGRTLP